MVDNINIVEKIEEYIKKKCEEYKNNSSDNYDFWNEHIKLVYKQSIILAVMYNADVEIVSLSALLHDIALVLNVGTKEDHHINGEKIAREILESYNYDKEKMERVLKCILNHRSSKNATNVEEVCVADADILAHFDNIPMLFNSAFVRNKVNLNDVRKWMLDVFEKDYNDLSENTKKLFKPKYDEIVKCVIGENSYEKTR